MDVIYIQANVKVIDKKIISSYSVDLLNHLFIKNITVMGCDDKKILYKELAFKLYLKGIPNKNENITDWLGNGISLPPLWYNILNENVPALAVDILFFISAIYLIVRVMAISNDIHSNKTNSINNDYHYIHPIDLMFPLD